jgi:effector-binding domain-containing protein
VSPAVPIDPHSTTEERDMSDFEIRHTTQQHTAALKMTRPLTQIGPAMAEAFPKIYHAVVSSGVEPAGRPLARYFDMGPEDTTFECAIPVPSPFRASGEVEAGSVGGTEAAFTVHVGPYDTIGATWQALMGWVAEQGKSPSGPGWESYLDEPGQVPDAELRTEIYLPVA